MVALMNGRLARPTRGAAARSSSLPLAPTPIPSNNKAAAGNAGPMMLARRPRAGAASNTREQRPHAEERHKGKGRDEKTGRIRQIEADQQPCPHVRDGKNNRQTEGLAR